MKPLARFICLNLLLILPTTLFSQQSTCPLEFSSASEHGVFLDDYGVVSGYFKVKNITEDTLTIIGLKWSWGGGCQFYTNVNMLPPMESGIIKFIGHVGEATYSYDIISMIADTSKTHPTKETILTISLYDQRQRNYTYASNSIVFWPLPVAAIDSNIDFELAVSRFHHKDASNGIVIKNLTHVRVNHGQEYTITEAIEVVNQTDELTYFLKQISSQDNENFEILSLANLSLLRPRKTFVYLIRCRLTTAEFEAMKDRIHPEVISLRLLFENAEGKQYEIRKKVKVDLTNAIYHD